MKVVISNNNQIGKVSFSKAARTITRLIDLIDVNVTGQLDGYVLAYQASTNTYIFREAAQTATAVDGGFY
jgi:hypothetical protein